MYRAAERTAPGMSYHEPPRRIAVEEFRLERLLQVMDGSGDRGLRDVALPRRLRQVERVCGSHEVLELREGKRQRGHCRKAGLGLAYPFLPILPFPKD